MKERKIETFNSVAFVLFLLFGLFSVAPLVMAQDTGEEETLPDIKALTKELGLIYKDNKNRDLDRIVAIYAIFDKSYNKIASKDQASVIKTMKKAYDLKLQPDEKKFLQSNAAALSSMGKKGVDTLLYALKSKAIKPRDRSDPADVQACLELETFIIESLGYSKEASALKPLLKLLWHDKGEIIKATCDALSRYNESSLKQRKMIVEEMIKVYTKIDNEVRAEPKRPELRERLVLTEGGFVAALQKLTPARHETAEDWQRWYNKNKSKKEW